MQCNTFLKTGIRISYFCDGYAYYYDGMGFHYSTKQRVNSMFCCIQIYSYCLHNYEVHL